MKYFHRVLPKLPGKDGGFPFRFYPGAFFIAQSFRKARNADNVHWRGWHEETILQNF